MSEDDTLPGIQTQTLQAPDPVQVMLARLTKTVETGFTDLRADTETLKNEGQRTNLRLTRLEMRQDDVETRLTRTSTRVKAESEHDMEQDTQLAQEMAAREALTAKVDTLVDIAGRLDRLFRHPVAKAVGSLLALALVTWLASHGVKVSP